MLILHDYHIHTRLSSCAEHESATVDRYIENAKRNNLKKIGFSDHMWDSAIDCPISWYYPQDLRHVSLIREELAKCDTQGLQVSIGCESEYDYAHHNIAMTEETAQTFGHILVPISHTHLAMPKEFVADKQRHADFMAEAFMDVVNSPLAKYVTAIAHPFDAVCCPYDNRELYPLIGAARFRDCFTAARDAEIALEVNISVFAGYTMAEILSHPALEMFEIGKDCGCKFIFGSDAHSSVRGEIQDRWELAYALCEILSLTEEDICETAR